MCVPRVVSLGLEGLKPFDCAHMNLALRGQTTLVRLKCGS